MIRSPRVPWLHAQTGNCHNLFLLFRKQKRKPVFPYAKIITFWPKLHFRVELWTIIGICWNSFQLVLITSLQNKNKHRYVVNPDNGTDWNQRMLRLVYNFPAKSTQWAALCHYASPTNQTPFTDSSHQTLHVRCVITAKQNIQQLPLRISSRIRTTSSRVYDSDERRARCGRSLYQKLCRLKIEPTSNFLVLQTVSPPKADINSSSVSVPSFQSSDVIPSCWPLCSATTITCVQLWVRDYRFDVCRTTIRVHTLKFVKLQSKM